MNTGGMMISVGLNQQVGMSQGLSLNKFKWKSQDEAQFQINSKKIRRDLLDNILKFTRLMIIFFKGSTQMVRMGTVQSGPVPYPAQNVSLQAGMTQIGPTQVSVQ